MRLHDSNGSRLAGQGLGPDPLLFHIAMLKWSLQEQLAHDHKAIEKSETDKGNAPQSRKQRESILHGLRRSWQSWCIPGTPVAPMCLKIGRCAPPVDNVARCSLSDMAQLKFEQVLEAKVAEMDIRRSLSGTVVRAATCRSQQVEWPLSGTKS